MTECPAPTRPPSTPPAMPAEPPPLPAAATRPTVETVHGTAVAWRGKGLLLLGPSGSGKSDLALRLIDAGAMLVADDLVQIEGLGDRPIARTPGEPGLIELRHHGVFRLPALAAAAIDLVVRLGQPVDAAERLPPPETCTLAGLTVPVVRLDPMAASAVTRLGLLLDGERVR